MEISVLENPVALPGKCYYCGGVSKNHYIDTGIQIEFYGALYICNECFVTLADKMGYLNKNDVKNLLDEVSQLRDHNDLLLSTVDSLQDALNSATKEKVSAARVNSDFHSSGRITYSDISNVEIHQQVDGGTQSTEGSLGEGEGEPPEQSDVENLARVRERTNQQRKSNFKF